jgi:hypothetical protein
VFQLSRAEGNRPGVTRRRISSTHGPRLDDELERETSALRESGGARAQDDREPEAPFPGELGEESDVPSPEDDPVLARRELSRHLRMTAFPAAGPELVAEARANDAPEWAIRLLEQLPDDVQYGTVYEVWDAVGGELEPGVHELLAERMEEREERD